MTAKIVDLPPLGYLREILDYNPETGVLTWRARPIEHFKSLSSCRTWNTRYAGVEAGGVGGGGYKRIRIDSIRYQAHRIAYFMHHGVEPDNIDHINHDRVDNRIENLRSVSHQKNSKNQSIAKNNTSGVTGVSLNKHAGKWLAQIKVNGNSKYLGFFDSFSDAVITRKLAEIKYGFHANHGKDV